MRRIIFLDSGPLGMACGSSGKPVSRGLRIWLADEATDGSAVVTGEVDPNETAAAGGTSAPFLPQFGKRKK